MGNVMNGASEPTSIVNKFFNVAESFRNEAFIEYVVISSTGDIGDSFNKLYDELVMLDYYPMLYSAGNVTVLRVINGRKTPTNKYRIPLALFGLTLISVLMTGYFIANNFCINLTMITGCEFGYGYIIYEVFLFTLSVLIPLVMHEVGHWFVIKGSNIPASYPVFIPAPLLSPLGTFGAIVRMNFLPKNLTCLLRLGVSGPLIGFVTSLTFFTISYSLSPKLPVEMVLNALSEGSLRYVEVVPISAYLIMNFVTAISNAELVTVLNPAAYASLIMIIIHFINLLPIGQLDGGHVVRGITSVKTHFAISMLTALAMVAVSLAATVFFGGTLIWLGVFSIIALLISGLRPHIGSANMLDTPVAKATKIKVALIYTVLLLLSAPLPTA